MTTPRALSAAQVAKRAMSFDWLTTRDGVLAWVQSPAVVRTWPADTVSPFPVGSDVHAYGGGPYALSDSGLWLVNESDGQVWAPAGRVTSSPYPHADLAWANGVLTCVRETPAGDELVLLDAAGEKVVHRADFLAAPRLRGDRLAWVQWSADVVPWDSSEVWVGTLPSLADAVRVAGGPGESATQPQWGPGGALYFMSDRTGWWNLYRYGGGSVAPLPAECAPAPWELGYASYTFLPGGRIAMAAQNGPRYRLLLADRGQVTEIPTPYTFLKPYLAELGDRVAVIGASPTVPQQVALVSTVDGSVEMVASGQLPQRVEDITVPEQVTIGEITTLVYWPAGEGPVPLIVRAHAGPTYSTEMRWDGEVQYFTSRGYAVADVDYHGSTGYGRTFRKALDGQWGILDVHDCTAVARHLAGSGRVRPDAVFISGASAGGYTALRAVSTVDSPFTLAVARSAIISPRRWTATAPRFQRPHAAILANHNGDVTANQITRPVLLIHGEKDAVAPIENAARLAVDLDQRQLLIDRIFLPGVGHYLTPDALVRALEAELAAYEQVLSR